jgi:hypothetical protein
MERRTKGQEVVFGVEAYDAKARGFETDEALFIFWIAELNLDALIREELIERIDNACVAGEMEAQVRKRQAGEDDILLTTKAQTSGRDGLHADGGAGRRCMRSG